MKCWLGLDLGTSSVKALLVNEEGQVLGRGHATYAPHHPHAGWVEQPLEDWWKASSDAIQQALSSKPTESTVCGLGLSGQMHGTLLLDEEFQPLSAAILWSDQRSQSSLSSLYEGWQKAGGVSLTGGPLAAGFQIATLQWIREHQPELWAKIRFVALPKDWLHWRLTGQWSTDPSDAAGTGMFDVLNGQWSNSLLALVGLTKEQLPSPLPSRQQSGTLKKSLATLWGLPSELPVTVGAGDTPCSLVGAGALREGNLLLTLSTGGQLVTPLSAYRVDPGKRLHTCCTPYALEEESIRWFQMGATLHAGASLQWLWRVMGQGRGRSFEDWIASANASPAGSRGLLFVPYLGGERTPHMDGDARGSWLGLTTRHNGEDMLRSVLEGVVFSCFDALQAFELVAPPQQLLLAGGGARNPLWAQIVADVFQVPVRCLETTEQSALGAGWLAASMTEGWTSNTPPESWVSYGDSIQPRNVRSSLYEEIFALYREQYELQKSSFGRLKGWEAGTEGKEKSDTDFEGQT